MFTGIRKLNAFILSYMDDISLCNMLKSSKYFSKFDAYDEMWKMKILSIFGKRVLDNYDRNGWKAFYITLDKIRNEYCVECCKFYDCDTWEEYYNSLKYARFYKIPDKVAFKLFKNNGENPIENIIPTYLKNKGAKIRRGDIVKVSATVLKKMDREVPHSCLIYDCDNFIELVGRYKWNLVSVYYYLNPKFHVLTLNNGRVFPIDYWKKSLNNYEPYLNLNNVKDRIKEEYNLLYLCESFKINKTLYTIIPTYSDIPATKYISIHQYSPTMVDYSRIPGIHLFH